MRILLILLAGTVVLAQEEDPVAFTVAGRVVDSKDEAQAGLRVEAWDSMQPERYLGQASTGAKGRFLLAVRYSAAARREHRHAPVLVIVRGKGIAEARAIAPPGTRELALSAVAARVIRGVVLDEHGKPVAAAVVSAAKGDAREETTTNEKGEFVLEHFARGPVAVTVNADGIEFSASVSADGENALEMPAVHTMRGRLLDAETGEPLVKARLLHRGRPAAVTHDGGGFLFRTTEPEVVLTPWKEGYAANEIGLVPGRPIDFRLERVAPLKGRVLDDDERPVGGARVSVGDLAVWTDDDGRFEFRHLPLGMHELRASMPEFVAAAVRVELGGAPDSMTLQVRRGATVGATVQFDGAPAFGARVAVHDEHGEVAVAFTDAQGRAVVRGIPGHARWIVASRAEGRRSMAHRIQRGPFRLELKGLLPLTGRVHSDTGGPLTGATVRCGDAETKTDAEGRFRLENLPPVPSELVIEHRRHAPLKRRVYPGRPLELVAESRLGDRVVAVTLLADGRGEAHIALRRRKHPRILRTVTVSLQSPTHSFAGLPPGTYDVSVKARGFLDAAIVVEAADKSVDAKIELERGGALTLRATPGAAVAIQRLQGTPPPVVALRLATGTRELRGFGPGNYRFIARAPGELIVIRDVALGPSTPPVELDLRGGKESTLIVDVRDATGAAVEGAEITLVAEGGFERNTRRASDRTGRVTLTRLFKGRMQVRAQRGNRHGAAAVDVTPGKELTLRVVVR